MTAQRVSEQAEEIRETLAKVVDEAEVALNKMVGIINKAFIFADKFLDNLDKEIEKVRESEKSTAPPKGATDAGTEDKAGTDNRVQDLLYIQTYMLEKHGYNYCKNTVWFTNPETISDQMVAATKYTLKEYEKKDKASFN